MKIIDSVKTHRGVLQHRVVAGEWQEFRSPDFSIIKQSLKDQVIFDGRNLYDPNFLKMQGLDYYGIGRGQSVASFGYSGPERRSG